MRTPAIIILTLVLAVSCASNRVVVNPQQSSLPAALASEVNYPRTTDASSFTQTQYDQHIAELKRKIPASGFSIAIQPPFVVIGNEAPQVVKQHSEETIKWAVEKLKQDYFSKDPADIVDIWLFKDAASYERYARSIFNDKPGTPYGYYSRGHKALIMNISTGGGTLVHEIVHPFIEANFPSCPAWFNEGLGSLYEQCGEEGGHIRGFVNWRLPGLQQAVKAGTLPSFKELTSYDTGTFYSDNRGVNYAQSRYLLYYLQEKGLLLDYYRLFYSQQKKDPTGYLSLTKILGTPNMDRFQRNWEKYVMELNEETR